MEMSIADVASARRGGREWLAAALADAREQLLRLWQAYGPALRPGGWQVRYLSELNPPLWELGHVAWFEEFWIARNPQRLRGVAANPEVPRAAPLLARADACYHSGRVAHTRRWHLDLPGEARTLAYAAATRERTLELLAQSAEDDDSLYFHRLALHHEDMHREAWIYMAQTLAIALGDAIERDHPAAVEATGEWALGGCEATLGSARGGFAFDNELDAHRVELAAFTIDRSAVTWRRYLPFVEAGGYADRRWWSEAGWSWRERAGLARPRHLSVDDSGGWKRAVFGRWEPVREDEPAVHLSHHEAQAWCRWAGRRLPTEAEWEVAARQAAACGETFSWGEVWEWTSTPFAPYPGFVAHPYRDYSQPWFDGRPVLRGACFATAPRLKHLAYRNYFTADRNDLFAGFRSCAA